jgi:hypothetical protein
MTDADFGMDVHEGAFRRKACHATLAEFAGGAQADASFAGFVYKVPAAGGAIKMIQLPADTGFHDHNPPMPCDANRGRPRAASVAPAKRRV